MNDQQKIDGVPSEFAAYFDLPSEHKAALIANAKIVFDTSTLLSLYRIEPKQRTVILSELVNRLQGRVWLPHQVFLEFARHMREEKVKDSQRLAKTQSAIQQKISDLRSEVFNQKLSELDADFSVENFNRKIGAMEASIVKSIERVKTAYPDLSKSDEVLACVLKIAENRIGAGFSSQDEVDAAVKSGEVRYSKEVPPGYLDQKKDGTFFHRGLQIPRKYGDWFIWSQLLKEIKDAPQDFQTIIFVTQDQKGDWWALNPEKSGEIVAPRFELRQEVEAAGAKVYWQYTFQSFYKHLISTDNGITADQSEQLKEISNAERRTQIDLNSRTEDWSHLLESAKSQNWNKAYTAYFSKLHDVSAASTAAFNASNVLKTWLREIAKPNVVVEFDGFPDFLVKPFRVTAGVRDHWSVGIEIIHPREPEHAVELVRVGLSRLSNLHPRRGEKLDKVFFLIVLNEVVMRGSKHYEWEETLVDLQGALLADQRGGLSIGFLKGGKFESMDELFEIEEPHLQEFLTSL